MGAQLSKVIRSKPEISKNLEPREIRRIRKSWEVPYQPPQSTPSSIKVDAAQNSRAKILAKRSAQISVNQNLSATSIFLSQSNSLNTKSEAPGLSIDQLKQVLSEKCKMGVGNMSDKDASDLELRFSVPISADSSK
jgi:hypothetical protein